MTTRDARGAAASRGSEEEAVAAYLQHHPDFFERHLSLLARLRLPHQRGGSSVVSLVERQISVLRDKHAALERKLVELVHAGRANDVLADKVHRLARRLMAARSRTEAVAHVEDSLRKDFDASHLMLALMGDYPDLAGHGFVHTGLASNPNLKFLESVFAYGKPRCGQLRDAQRELLFGREARLIGSVALLPLARQDSGRNQGPLGLLALGSADPDRFHPGMGTDFLARVGDYVGDALTRPPRR